MAEKRFEVVRDGKAFRIFDNGKDTGKYALSMEKAESIVRKLSEGTVDYGGISLSAVAVRQEKGKYSVKRDAQFFRILKNGVDTGKYYCSFERAREIADGLERAEEVEFAILFDGKYYRIYADSVDTGKYATTRQKACDIVSRLRVKGGVDVCSGQKQTRRTASVYEYSNLVLGELVARERCGLEGLKGVVCSAAREKEEKEGESAGIEDLDRAAAAEEAVVSLAERGLIKTDKGRVFVEITDEGRRWWEEHKSVGVREVEGIKKLLEGILPFD